MCRHVRINIWEGLYITISYEYNIVWIADCKRRRRLLDLTHWDLLRNMLSVRQWPTLFASWPATVIRENDRIQTMTTANKILVWPSIYQSLSLPSLGISIPFSSNFLLFTLDTLIPSLQHFDHEAVASICKAMRNAHCPDPNPGSQWTAQLVPFPVHQAADEGGVRPLRQHPW